MDHEALAALVPELMKAHPDIDWKFIETNECFALEIRPISDPGRLAEVYVSESTEMFWYVFAGHEARQFAYETPEKREVLEEQLAGAVAAVRGPTQVLLDWAGDDVVRSGISHNVDGEDPEAPTVDWLPKRIWWWMQGRQLRREILKFPAI